MFRRVWRFLGLGLGFQKVPVGRQKERLDKTRSSSSRRRRRVGIEEEEAAEEGLEVVRRTLGDYQG
jgi:hypothetical protein